MARNKLIIVRTDDIEAKLLQAKADKFTDGNYSEFLRLAIMRWEPELSDDEKRQNKHIRKYLK